MKLLVLAQTPPPLHGQSVMVETLVTGLPAHGIAVHHVNLRLSRDAADIGRWRAGKIGVTLAAAARAVVARFRHGCDTLYYVPAPGKRAALYRDWLVMLLCRPFFPRLVLHWHACGLGAWLATRATAPERWLTRALLGRADLAIVLADPLCADAEYLGARRVAVVPNGIADPGEPVAKSASSPCRLLFLGLCSEEKGLFAAAEAVIAANRRCDSHSAGAAFTLAAAGPFDCAETAARFTALCRAHSDALHHVGVVDATQKRQLFAECHALLFPTHYPAEGMPLVTLEALAHDRPVIATDWRGLPAIVTPETGTLVAPGDVAALTDAILRLRDCPPAAGRCRTHFLARFRVEAHVAALADAIRSVSSAPRP